MNTNRLLNKHLIFFPDTQHWSETRRLDEMTYYPTRHRPKYLCAPKPDSKTILGTAPRKAGHSGLPLFLNSSGPFSYTALNCDLSICVYIQALPQFQFKFLEGTDVLWKSSMVSSTQCLQLRQSINVRSPRNELLCPTQFPFCIPGSTSVTVYPTLLCILYVPPWNTEREPNFSLLSVWLLIQLDA